MSQVKINHDHDHDDDHGLDHDDDHGGDGEDDMHTLDSSLWISVKSRFKEKCTTFANHYFENLNFYSNLILI